MLHRIKKKNDIHQGKWNGLGGKFEQGESPEDCVIREIKEESGLELSNPSLRGFISFPLFKDNKDWYVFIFTADQFTGDLIESPEGMLQWIDDDKLLELNLWDGDPIFMNWIFNDNKMFSARFEYINKQLISHSVNFY